jgi:hypothetical protein
MMTEPYKAHRAGTPTATNAQDRLRTELLTSGLYDWVPLVAVQTAITHYHLAETLRAQQDLALQTIRSLVEDAREAARAGRWSSGGSISHQNWNPSRPS